MRNKLLKRKKEKAEYREKDSKKGTEGRNKK
jgi:hypothetical protein